MMCVLFSASVCPAAITLSVALLFLIIFATSFFVPRQKPSHFKSARNTFRNSVTWHFADSSWRQNKIKNRLKLKTTLSFRFGWNFFIETAKEINHLDIKNNKFHDSFCTFNSLYIDCNCKKSSSYFNDVHCPKTRKSRETNVQFENFIFWFFKRGHLTSQQQFDPFRKVLRLQQDPRIIGSIQLWSWERTTQSSVESPSAFLCARSVSWGPRAFPASIYFSEQVFL